MKKPEPPQDMWAQMDSITSVITRDDPGVSAYDFAGRYRISETQARRKLHDLVAQGKLIEGRRKIPGGNFMKVYRPK